MEIIIVPFTGEKIWSRDPNAGSTPARSAYTKPCFRGWVEVADASGNRWFALSTKYGLLEPDEVISAYEAPVSVAKKDAK